MASKKPTINKIKLSLLTLAIFIFSSLILVGITQVKNFSQNSLKSFSSLKFNSENIIPEVKSANKVSSIKLISVNLPEPKFSSKAIYAEDLSTSNVLFQRNIHQRLSPASTTKVMTALIALDYFQPGDILVVPKEALVGGSSMDLQLGEKVTFRSVLYGMMLNSGNDAAYTIAYNYPAGFDSFVLEMNKKAKSLGLKDTNFTNPAGFDTLDHYSSAFDLSLIAKEAIKNPQLARIVSTLETSVLSADNSTSHNLKNLNQLLGEEGILGIKTGFTEKSGENLVGLVERQNKKILTVVLNSEDRFGETRELINWVFQNYRWEMTFN